MTSTRRRPAAVAATLIHCLALLLAASAVSAASQVIQDCTACPVVVVVPAGKFSMGSADNPLMAPVHPVTLARRFAIGRNEVTEREFSHFLERTGYNAGPEWSPAARSSRLPATNVDRHAALAYVRWLSRHTGQRYRLPSEAEWEYAARAGQTGPYWWGGRGADGCAREYLPSTFYGLNDTCSGAQATPGKPVIDVASMSPNPWGLYDTMGNAGEWTVDCPPLGSTGYQGAPADGSAFAEAGEVCGLGIVRAAGYLGEAAPRSKNEPEYQAPDLGFRVVREVP